MIDPILTIDPDLKFEPEKGSAFKKEPKMRWEIDPKIVLNPNPSPTNSAPVRAEIAISETTVSEPQNEKERLLHELLESKDQRIDALREIIVLQRKLIEQLESRS